MHLFYLLKSGGVAPLRCGAVISRYFIDCIVTFLNTTAKSPRSQIEVMGVVLQVLLDFGTPGAVIWLCGYL
jgi:hypothetical protein